MSPATGLNWFDVIVLVFIFYSLLQGTRLGFIHQLFSLLQIAAAYVVSISYFRLLGDLFDAFLNINIILINIAAFLILFFATRFLINIIGEIIGVGTFLPIIGSLNRILGGFFGLVKGIIVATIVIGIMYVLPWEFFQSSLWNSQVFILWLELWPQMLEMLMQSLS